MYNVLHAISTRKKRGKLLALIFAMAFLGFADFIPQAFAQGSVVTFQNDRLKFNGSDYATKGWYGLRYYAPGTQPAWNTGAESVGFVTMTNNNQQVLLTYWNAIVDLYRTRAGINAQSYTLNDYVQCLQLYLNDAQTNFMKVIVHIPDRDGTNMQNPTDGTWVNTIVNAVRNHPALLGYYTADEPETSNWSHITYQFLRDRYNQIRSIDINHPVVAVIHKPGDSLTVNTFWGEFGPGGQHRGMPYSNKIFDLLGLDHYPMRACDNIYSANNQTALSYNLWWARGILWDQMRKLYLLSEPNSNRGGLFFVGQGFGSHNIAGQFLIFEGNPSSWRTPTVRELFFSWMNAYQLSQFDHTTANKDRTPINGVISWDYSQADTTSRKAVHEMSKFMHTFNLDMAFRAPRWNGRFTHDSQSPSGYGGVSGTAYLYGSDVYVVMINYSVSTNNTVQQCVANPIGQYDTTSITTYLPISTNNINFRLYTNSIIDYCHQIAPPSLTTDSRYTLNRFPYNAFQFRWVPITTSSDQFGRYYTLNFNPQDAINFEYLGYEVKIFRLRLRS